MTTNDGIEARGNGWRITVATGRDPITGEYGRIREHVNGTKTDARRRRDELRVQVQRGTAVRADREIVADFLARWIAHRVTIGKIRPQVARTYSGYARRQVVPVIGATRLDSVRPRDVQAVLDAATADGLAPRSVVQVHRIMYAAFRQAVRWQAIATNPSDGVTPPKVEAPKLTVPTPGEIARLLDAVDPWHRAAIALAAGTGLRRGELLALTWDGVSLDGVQPSIRVQGTLQRDADGDLVVLPPKTERSRRTVPLSTTMAVLLRGVRAVQLERRMLAGPAWHATDYVFDRGTGEPIDPDELTRAFRPHGSRQDSPGFASTICGTTSRPCWSPTGRTSAPSPTSWDTRRRGSRSRCTRMVLTRRRSRRSIRSNGCSAGRRRSREPHRSCSLPLACLSR
jgi:integrase